MHLIARLSRYHVLNFIATDLPLYKIMRVSFLGGHSVVFKYFIKSV